ncbi:MAG: hypothetical protein WD576_00080, partial [Nitriliruptoraceae bacterium]
VRRECHVNDAVDPLSSGGTKPVGKTRLPELKRQLRIRAATSGHSMEEEARNILRAELAIQDDEPADLYQQIRHHIDPLGGVDLPLPDRESRVCPKFR